MLASFVSNGEQVIEAKTAKNAQMAMAAARRIANLRWADL
jgi:hypothetical protein